MATQYLNPLRVKESHSCLYIQQTCFPSWQEFWNCQKCSTCMIERIHTFTRAHIHTNAQCTAMSNLSNETATSTAEAAAATAAAATKTQYLKKKHTHTAKTVSI